MVMVMEVEMLACTDMAMPSPQAARRSMSERVKAARVIMVRSFNAGPANGLGEILLQERTSWRCRSNVFCRKAVFGASTEPKCHALSWQRQRICGH
jgi:hypothetical protein